MVMLLHLPIPHIEDRIRKSILLWIYLLAVVGPALTVGEAPLGLYAAGQRPRRNPS